jgi:hypothetical protein
MLKQMQHIATNSLYLASHIVHEFLEKNAVHLNPLLLLFNPFAYTHGRDTCELARSVVYTHGCETG